MISDNVLGADLFEILTPNSAVKPRFKTGTRTMHNGATYEYAVAGETIAADAQTVNITTVSGVRTASATGGEASPPGAMVAGQYGWFNTPITGAANAFEVTAITAYTRDFVVFDPGGASGTEAASVPVAGTTNAPDGMQIQVRAVSTEDGGAASTAWVSAGTATGGTWSANITLLRIPSWYRWEARVANSTAAETVGSQEFAVGYNTDFWGQSELHRAVLSAFNTSRTPATITDEQCLQVSFCDATGSGWGQSANFEHGFVTNSNQYTGNLNELANYLATVRPGYKFHIVFHTLSGTGVTELRNDSQTGRQWADDLALRNFAYADGQSTGLAIQSWYAADASLGDDYGDAWLRMITGLDTDGTPFTGFDHTFAEIYEYTETLWAIAGPHRFEQDSFDANIPSVRASLDAAFQNPVLSNVAVRVNEALAYLNGNGSQSDVSHPNANVVDGQARLMLFMGLGMMQALGYEPDTPVLNQWTYDNGTLTIGSDAGNITTTRLARGDTPSVPAQNARVEEVFVNGTRTTNVSIVSGEIVVTGLSNGDVVIVGSDGIGTDNESADLLNQTWLDYPIIDRGQEGVEGIPVRGRAIVTDGVIPAMGAPAGYDPTDLKNLVPASHPFRTGSATVSGDGGWNNVGGHTNGVFNGDGTISLGPDNNQTRGNAEEVAATSGLNVPVINKTVDVNFYITTPDGATGSLDVIIRQAGGGNVVLTSTNIATPVMGQLYTYQVTPTASRDRIEILFDRPTGGQTGTYVIHTPTLIDVTP